ncbi:hypothetical protein AMK59_1370 [Oryctes borbonicus]|uniref:Single domain-containing protein n=1 Tax=Oryctes borbonicus TaxID=1629725 RepID=A0A0T6BFX5_9SCAR|nr:hypothetical protein AMK59_1370 [Oryctes borbonicus]
MLIIPLVCLIFSTVCCSVEISTEKAPITTGLFLHMGYSCESANPNLGALRDGEVRKRYEHYICGQATCRQGEIFYETCGTIAKENDCAARYKHYYNPYPECCTSVECN